MGRLRAVLSSSTGAHHLENFMFHLLDSTIEALLCRELPPGLVNQVGISFARPDSEFPSASIKLPTLNLFLYDIQENRELRGTEPSIERQADGRVVRTPPPVRVDCHYLVTAWPSREAPQPEQDEHWLLGEALRALLRHREIPVELLHENLRPPAAPVRAAALLQSQQPSRGDFWQALGGKPRAAFSYVVTLAIDVHGPEDAGVIARTSVVKPRGDG